MAWIFDWVSFAHLASVQYRADGYQHKSFLNLLLIQLCAGAALLWFGLKFGSVAFSLWVLVSWCVTLLFQAVC